jgi:integrase
MPKLRNKLPSYCRHKASGQAVVTLNGRDNYLGEYGTPESRERYEQLIAEWVAAKRPSVTPAKQEIPQQSDLRICELVTAYLEFAKTYYVKNGRRTGEYTNMKHAVAPLGRLYSRTRITDFRPSGLKAVRQAMIDAKLSRRVINSRINRIRRVFKWGVENEFAPPEILHALQAVAPLKAGRTEARERGPVRPVPRDDVDAVLKRVARPVAGMIRVQEATGMRPGEVVLMRGCDIDMSGRVWLYRPPSHKTEHHGIERTVYLGPRAQAELRPFLKPNPRAYLFSPKEGRIDLQTRALRAAGHTRTKVKLPRKGSLKTPGDHYTAASYCYAINKACKKAKIPVWGPNRLRHNAATFLRKEFGIEAARVILGHRSATVTEVYAELDRAKAADIMSRVG